MSKLSTGCKSIDDLLLGGIPRGSPLGLFGLWKIGKSVLCYQTAVKTVVDNRDSRVLYIDTEAMFLDDVIDSFYSWYKNRWKIDDSYKKRIEFLLTEDLFDLFRQLGMDLVLKQEQDRVSATVKFPKRDREEVAKTTEQTRDWIEYSPIYKRLEKNRYDLLILDSLTIPIKEKIPTVTQNFPARSTIISFIISALKILAKRFNMGVIFTNHAVRSPMMQHALSPWGGDNLLYEVKYWVSILDPLKDQKQKYGDRARRVMRYRYPYQEEAIVLVKLEKDTGFIDIEDTKKISLKG